MHEWALAEAVLETAKRILRERGGSRVISVTVVFGELQAVDADIFRTGLDLLAAKAPFAEDFLMIVTEKASFRCLACDTEWSTHSDLTTHEKEAIHLLPETAHVYLRCPSCRSPDFKIERGRGVFIRSIEIEE